MDLKNIKKIILNKEIILIAAVSANNIIGNKNKLPWYIPQDLTRFKNLTTGYIVIMGKNTFYSINKPLKNRINIVLTHDKCNNNKIDFHKINSYKKIFIIGGASIYKIFLNMNVINKLEITKIYQNFQGDTVFPKIQLNQWRIIYEKYYKKNSINKYKFVFRTYIKK
jgi:dihydrofolate reductase